MRIESSGEPKQAPRTAGKFRTEVTLIWPLDSGMSKSASRISHSPTLNLRTKNVDKMTGTSQDQGAQALKSWEANAEFWDQGVGVGGNEYWSKLQEPTLQRFFGAHLEREDCSALDLSTGNGLCARWLAERGATVLATDGAQNMIDKARSYGSPGKEIEFRKVDVTSESDLEMLVKVRVRFARVIA